MDGITAIDLLDLVIEVLHSSPHHSPSTEETCCMQHTQFGTRPNRRTKKESNTSEGFGSAVVDYVTPILETLSPQCVASHF